jgi:hypothetical protein
LKNYFEKAGSLVPTGAGLSGQDPLAFYHCYRRKSKMTHDQIIEILKGALEKAKGVGVNLDYHAAHEAPGAVMVSTLKATLLNTEGNQFIVLSTVRDELEKHTKDVKAEYFGLLNQVVFYGTIDGKRFECRIHGKKVS